MIEAENVHLKKLIVSMSDEKEELQKTLARYEHHVGKMQHEKEELLDKNSKLVDLIDQNNREMLTRQPILNDVFSFNPPRSCGSIHNQH